MATQFFIDPDITQASTLPAYFYKDQDIFDALKDKIFIKSWQWIGSDDLVPLSNYSYPFFLLDHYIAEPMLLIRNAKDELNCFSNVCTHRAVSYTHLTLPTNREV